jgi:thiol-disulfide isomerase/thioredoxin
MDRLPSVRYIVIIGSLVAVEACRSESADGPTKHPPGRVVAVQAKGEAEIPLAEFCDVTSPKKLTLPETHQPPPSRRPGTRWVNVWATWCKPCIKEMPMLAEWEHRFVKAGIATSLDFLSVDEEAATLAAFMKSHPEIPATLQLKDPEALAPWLAGLGLDPGAGLPIHVFADVQGTIRCVRAAAISENHFATIEKLMR